MSRWLRLGDLISIQRGTTYKSALLDRPGPVLLGLASIQRNGGFRQKSLRTYGGDSPDQLLVRPGEIYASLKDVTQSADLLGSVARLPAGFSIGRLTQDTVRLDLISREIDANYLYWCLRTPQYRQYCRSRATGTTNLGLPRDDFLAFEIPPPTAGRVALVSALGALEDLLDINARLIHCCTALAAARFRLLVARVAESVAFSETVDILSGGTPKTSEADYWGGTIPWFSVADTPDDGEAWVIRTTKHITNLGLEESPAQILEPGTTIVTARGTVGKVALVGASMAMNQSCYGLRSLVGRLGYFTFFATVAAVDTLRRQAHGSVFDTITRASFNAIEIALPSKDDIATFESLVDPLMQQARELLWESETLCRARGELLPLLFSKRLCVEDVAA